MSKTHTRATMPGMRRRVFALMAVLSAALCVAACALWCRSLLVLDHLYVARWESTGSLRDDLNASSDNGFWRLSISRSTPTAPTGLSPGTMGKPLGFAGIEWSHEAHGASRDWDFGLWSWLWWDHYRDLQRGYSTECWWLQVRPWFVARVFTPFPDVDLVAIKTEKTAAPRPLHRLWLRPSRHPRPVPRVRVGYCAPN